VYGADEVASVLLTLSHDVLIVIYHILVHCLSDIY